MAQDIRDLLKKEQSDALKIDMSEGHEARFLKKLNAEFPESPKKSRFNWTAVAASMVLGFALSFGAYNYFASKKSDMPLEPDTETVTITQEKAKTLGDLSPDFKKIEDYYLASIHTELSKVELTPENKELIDGYILRLEELSNEYKTLSLELTTNGPSELTVNALIDNLKLRLNLLYRLRDQLKDLESEPIEKDAEKQSV